MYRRKLSQLKGLTKRLKKELNSNFINQKLIGDLIDKINLLINELILSVGRVRIKRIVGSLAFIFFTATSHNLFSQAFSPPVISPFGLTQNGYNLSFAFSDLDNDGDLDLLSGKTDYYDGKTLAYFENIGSASSPNFNFVTLNPFGIPDDTTWENGYPTFGDLDNDGDLDLMVGRYDHIVYYENTGSVSSPSFGSPLIAPYNLSSSSFDSQFKPLSFVDIDGDGDLDLVQGGFYGNILFYINSGTPTNPTFANPAVNQFGLTTLPGYFAQPDFADFDGDGDFDIICSNGNNPPKYYYFNNSGTATNPQFDSPVLNPFGINVMDSVSIERSPRFGDIDNDGDFDIISVIQTSCYAIDFTFYKNGDGLGPKLNPCSGIGVENKVKKNLSISPNPSNGVFKINDINIGAEIEVFNMLNQSVFKTKTTNTYLNIDLNNFPGGIYLLTYTSKGETHTSKLVKEQ